MEQKIKFVIIGLAGLVLVSGILFVQQLGTTQNLTRERNELQAEKDSLTTRLNKMQEERREYENKIFTLQGDLEKLKGERRSLEEKFNLLNKEKETLVEKLKDAKKQAQQAAQAGQSVSSQVPVTTDAYWAGVLKAKTDLEMQADSIKSELKSIQIANEELQRQKSSLELDIKNMKFENEELKRRMDYNQKLMDSIGQDLVREKNDKMKIEDTLKILKNENQSLTRQVKALSNRKIGLEKRVQEVLDEKASIARRIDEMEAMLTNRISQVNSLKEQLDAIGQGTAASSEKKESVELPPIVVRPQSSQEASSQAPQEKGQQPQAKVIAINKESKFVVIDQGETAGITVGDKLNIYRDGRIVANIVVIQTRKNISACDLKKEFIPAEIGDLVK